MSKPTRWRLAIGIAIFMIAIFCYASLRLSKGKPTQEEAALETQTKLIRYNFSIRNMSEQPRAALQVRVFAPFEKLSHQRTKSLSASLPHEITSGSFEEKYLEIKSDLPPYGVKHISVEALVELTSLPKKEPISAPEKYLASEPLIPLTEKVLVEKANSFRGGNPTTLARDIFNFTSKRITPSGYWREPKGAVFAMNQSKGDCTEFAYLFAALARIRGIPTRVMGGFIVDKNMNLKPISYHNWAEYYDGQSWRIADPDKGNFDTGYLDYVAFRQVSPTESSWERYQQIDKVEIKMY